MENMEIEKDIKFESDKNTFLLNTNNNCFLCLSTNYSDDNQDEINKVSVLSISRYLGISLKDFLSNSLREKGLQKEKDRFQEKVSDCSVMLCEGCASITSRLSGLCMELELLRMKVDNCLQSFLDELEDSEMDRVRVQRFQLMKAENLEEVHVELAQMLRKKMKKQCSIKLNSVLPKIVIGGRTRTEEPNCEVPPSQDVQPAMSLPSSFKMPELAEQNFENENKDNLESLPEDNCKKVPPKSNKNNPGLPTFHFENAPEPKSRYESGRIRYTVACTLCKPPRQITVCTRRIHQLRAHLDVLMIDYKLSNISQEDFKIYCDHVFKVETLASQKGTSYFECPYCPMNYKIHASHKIHLFKEHKKIISKKIIELQKGTTVQEIQFIKLPSLEAASGETWKCDDCGTTFNTKRGFTKHKKHRCKTKLKPIQRKLELQKNTLSSRPQECPVCGEKFRNASEVKAHQISVHGHSEVESTSDVTTLVQDSEIGTQECSIEVDSYGDQDELNLKRKNEDEFKKEIYGNVDDLQQQQIIDVDTEKDGFVVKTEHCHQNMEAILPDILEDDPLNM